MYVDAALLLLRIVIGGVVIPHGLLKLGLVGTGGSLAGVGGWFNSMGLRPGLFWAYVATLAEAGGGLLTVLGLGGPIGLEIGRASGRVGDWSSDVCSSDLFS